MSLNAIEVIALIFVLVGLCKIFFLLVNKRRWYEKVAKPIYTNTTTSTLIFIVLALVMFYYLIQYFNLTEIFAIMAFTSVLMAIGFLIYGKHIVELIEKVLNKKFTFWRVFYAIIFLVLLVLALYEILFT
ncbi:MAG: hypothetical protein AABW56_02690 [Nanoarchaeota archaeon]